VGAAFRIWTVDADAVAGATARRPRARATILTQ
jgi:hypothetical protein